MIGHDIDTTPRRPAFPLFLVLLLLSLPFPATAAGETVCLQCHSTQTGRGLAPVKPWQGSVHGGNGISCQHCHGGDPQDSSNAMNPQRGFLGVPREVGIPAFCGRCHIGIRDEYLKSAHGRALGRGGPTCVTCHGSHDIQKATIDLISEKNCSRCHGYERARLIRKSMEKTDGNLSQLGLRIQKQKEEGVDVSSLEKSHFAQRNSYHALFHETSPSRLDAQSAKIGTELKRIGAELDRIDAEHERRKRMGVVAILAALAAAFILNQLKKTCD